MRRCVFRASAFGLAYSALLLTAAPALAQQSGLGGASLGGSSAGSGGLGGSSFGSGGLGGSSLGGGSSGSSGSFGLGTAGFGTTGAGGAASLGGTGRAGTTQIGATSFEGAYFINPFALGLPTSSSRTIGSNASSTPTVKFGFPLYTLTTLTTGTASVNSQNNNLANGFGAGVGLRRLPAYATTIKFAVPPPPPAAVVRADLLDMLAQTTQLDPRDSVRILMDGSAVVLRGRVVDDDERNLVENMIRLTPGVVQVRNELDAGKPAP